MFLNPTPNPEDESLKKEIRVNPKPPAYPVEDVDCLMEKFGHVVLPNDKDNSKNTKKGWLA